MGLLAHELELQGFRSFTRNHYDRLLELRNLRVFRIQNMVMPVDGADISVIIAAWQHIASLHIPTTSSLPINSLAFLAQNCSHLIDLEVTISTLGLPPFTTTPICAHPLHTLNVAKSGCLWATLHIISWHLDRLFPRLCSLITLKDGDESEWAKVQALLFMFQDARMHTPAQT
ncbi:hypothetical protein MVEN_02576500 [Mycena venus]|uniref:Uncharacterized protein n=1 Tax=Mycena venus TaxID=2733690 RepID=A0A8H6U3G3_9AGAR|nr:hypothetical protein MVEN_02576500 [Mycena venus]